MKLRFLGTRGYVTAAAHGHRRHSALLVTHRRARIMLDCGADWLGRLRSVEPDAIVLTHAHPDHAWGLARGAPCPVWATRRTHRAIAGYPIADRRIVSPRRPWSIAGVRFEAFAVEHSIRAPAVGFRLSVGRRAVFYVPDVVAIRARSRALAGVGLYVGDGASRVRPLLRRRRTSRFGHASIAQQLGWCAREGVPRAIFTHCGEAIVTGDGPGLRARIRAMGEALGVAAAIARDGETLAPPRRG